jgi:hypothetical protein
MRLSTAVAMLGLVVVAIGSVGPWIDTVLGSAGGLLGDGRITIGAAVLGAIALAVARGRTWGRVIAWFAAAVALTTAGYDFFHIRHEAVRATLFGHQIADVGWGPIAVMIGAAVTSAAVVAESAPRRRRTLTALACVGTVGALVAGALQEPSRAEANPRQSAAVATTPTSQNSTATSPAAATTTSSSVSETSLPAVPTSLGPPAPGQDPQVRPDVIVYTGDGTGLFAGLGSAGRQPDLGRLRWTTWNGEQAVANGGDWTDNCTPDCASGVHSSVPVTLTASAPGSLDGYKVFTRLNVDFLNALPPGLTAHSLIWSLTYAPTDGFSWTTGAAPNVPQPSTSTTPTVAADSSSCDEGPCTLSALPHQCSAGLTATQSISCGLASNVFYEYFEGAQGAGSGASLSAWSPATQQYYEPDCSAGDGVVSCAISGTTDSNATVEFTQAAVDAYTQQAANAYAGSHPIGPQ